MNATILLIVVLVVAGIAAVFATRKVLRNRFAASRRSLPLNAQARGVSDGLSEKVYVEVLTELGASFELDPTLIRPEDDLAIYYAIDSWDLGSGQDKLEQWLKEKKLGPNPGVKTVLDLVHWVQAGNQAGNQAGDFAATP